jgi:hypothetical protein
MRSKSVCTLTDWLMASIHSSRSFSDSQWMLNVRMLGPLIWVQLVRTEVTADAGTPRPKGWDPHLEAK